MRYERSVMKAEVEILHLLKETGAVPVPRVYYYEAETENGHECFLMEFLPGQPYNKVKELLAAEERRQIEEELGQLNRRINTIRSNRFGYYAQETEQGNDWPTVFAAMVS